jgi:hypothetical protein
VSQETLSCRTADSLCRDFDALVTIFDQHLSNCSGTGAAERVHCVKAKAAAERGRLLSGKLSILMRSCQDTRAPGLRNFAN